MRRKRHSPRGKSSIFLALLVLVTLVVVPTVQGAAQIHGMLYDLDLERVDQAIVEISTTPKQRVVSNNGSYAFNVDQGSYVIKAHYKENATVLTTEERIVVKEDGSYVFDLFLLPSFETEDEILTDISLDVEEVIEEDRSWVKIAIFTLVSGIFIVVLYIFYKIMMHPDRRKKRMEKRSQKKITHAQGENTDKKEETKHDVMEEEITPEKNLTEYEDDQYSKQVLSILEKHEGRATQKEIRKDMPVSEAKISLVLTDLENSGKIRKIKKGRGNIIILNKEASSKKSRKRGNDEKEEEQAKEEGKQNKEEEKQG